MANITIIHSTPPAEGDAWIPQELGGYERVLTFPMALTEALCDFLRIPRGSLRSRADVFKMFVKYAKDNNLMRGQIVQRDAALNDLLGLHDKPEDFLTILNLQGHLKRHLIPVSLPIDKLNFFAWWISHDRPQTVNVNMTGLGTKMFVKVYKIITYSELNTVTFRVYTGPIPAGSPCGCTEGHTCEYHLGALEDDCPQAGFCGCCAHYNIKCPAHIRAGAE